MKETLVQLLTSKKVITAVIGVVATIAARKGFELDIELCAAIAGMFGVLIGAQGAADHGKEAAKINAAKQTDGAA